MRFAGLVSPALPKRPVLHEYAYSDSSYRVHLSTQGDHDNFKDMIEATPHQKAKFKPYEVF